MVSCLLSMCVCTTVSYRLHSPKNLERVRTWGPTSTSLCEKNERNGSNTWHQGAEKRYHLRQVHHGDQDGAPQHGGKEPRLSVHLPSAGCVVMINRLCTSTYVCNEVTYVHSCSRAVRASLSPWFDVPPLFQLLKMIG
jgi:hypothetical protein